MSIQFEKSVSVDLSRLLIDYKNHDVTIGVIGMGYVGLPLAEALVNTGFNTIGFDVDDGKVQLLKEAKSYINHISKEKIASIKSSGLFTPTSDFSLIKSADVLLICVPTPLNKHREPDMSFVVETTKVISKYLRNGQLVVLESTTYPGTTQELMRPILEKGGLKSGRDFFLAYSPEREDPGNPNFRTATIPKVVGGDCQSSTALAATLYGEIVSDVVQVSSTATAEAVKLTENIFRSVNIALVNELKIVYEKMGVDVWEVIDAQNLNRLALCHFILVRVWAGIAFPLTPFI